METPKRALPAVIYILMSICGVCVCVCIYIYTHIYSNIYHHIICKCMCVYMYMHMHMYMYIHIHASVRAVSCSRHMGMKSICLHGQMSQVGGGGGDAFLWLVICGRAFMPKGSDLGIMEENMETTI